VKVLVSACVFGKKVRWNGSSKISESVMKWAKDNQIELIPVCPENELFGTPRSTIRLVQIDNETIADMKSTNVMQQLDKKSIEILQRYPEIKGFIGIYGSPSCGISVGVKNLGNVVKGSMHKNATIPTTEAGHIGNAQSSKQFLNRLKTQS